MKIMNIIKKESYIVFEVDVGLAETENFQFDIKTFKDKDLTYALECREKQNVKNAEITATFEKIKTESVDTT